MRRAQLEQSLDAMRSSIGEQTDGFRKLSDVLEREQERRAATWLDKVTSKKVVIHTVTERSLEGVLAGVYEDGVVLRAVVVLGTDPPIRMAGDVYVPRDRILMAQVDDG